MYATSWPFNFSRRFEEQIPIQSLSIKIDTLAPTMVLSAAHPQEECFAFVSEDNRLKVWDMKSGSLRQEYVDKDHLSYKYTCISWCYPTKKSKKAKRTKTVELGTIALGTDSGEIVIWDLQQAEVVQRLSRENSDQAHTKSINAIVCSSSGDKLFSCTDEKNVLEWDLLSGKVVRKFKGGHDGVSKLALSSDDTILATASSSIKLWDLASGQKTKRFISGHTSSVICLNFSSCNRYLFSAERAGRFVNMFDCSTMGSKEPMLHFALEHHPISLFVKLNEEMCHLGAVADSGCIYLWEKEITGPSTKPILPKAISNTQANVVAAYFTTNESSKISLARGSIAKPLFDTVEYMNKAGDVVTELTTVSPAENILLGEEEHATLKKQRVHVVSLADKSLSTNVTDMDDIITDTSGDEGITLAERLEQMQNAIDNSLPEEDEEEEEEAIAPPQSGSLVTVLEQALQSNDNSMLEYCLRLTDKDVIHSTVERMSSSRVVPFLTRIVNKFEKRPARGSSLCIWIRAILKHHAAFLMTVPELVHKLSTLYQTLEARLSIFSQLHKVSGRLELVLDQIARRNDTGVETEGVVTEPICTYNES